MDKNIPDGKITTLVQIGIDESGRTIIRSNKDLQVDSILLGRILEAWLAFYLKANEMPALPPPDEEKSLGPLICPKCGQQALNYQTGKCQCGFASMVPPGMPPPPQPTDVVEEDKWEPKLVHCRECGRDVRIETRPDSNAVKCGCGRDIYVGPERRK